MNVKINPKIVVSIVYITAMFMAAMDATIVNVALRTISQELQVPPSAMGTVNVGYLVSLAVFLPISGWLGDRFGTKRVFLTALLVFTIASALCGFANDITSLNIFRIIQGAGGGLLTPVGMAMLFRTFSPEERPKISRFIVLPVAVAPAIGPIISGFFVDQLSWRWAFYINLPFGIVVLLFGLLFLVEHVETTAGRLDLPGFILSAPGFAMLIYALSQGPSKGWSSPEIIGTGVGGMILITLFIIVELRVQQPMLDLRLLKDPLFRNMSLISLFSAAGLLGMLFVFPLMYQNVLHASALETGLTTFPEAIGLMVASQLVPWSYKKLGARKLISTGLVGSAIIFVLLSFVNHETNPWMIRMLLFGIGVFLGHSVGAVQFSAFNNIQPASMGRATTIFNVQNRLGSAIGVAILASLLAGFGSDSVSESGSIESSIVSYQIALIGAAVFLFIALLFALRIRDQDAMSKGNNKPLPTVKEVREKEVVNE
ncbi:DHA2 family efflux MFS transporter permease subunit [Bacillus clarus]|uniref:DHA2 family efflux MFS transporter permease subunit n=1 Tax=Bacillus clarus TaxID=2338372 RepID=A0A090YV03_9BACI|nr:MDR family MFS transporter [Bacillus clarus]KFN02062.1 drug resistance MFS transporter, drug:H+ antiporter-2 family protein [Bacillus clarus]RFT67600.1 DHA2 family efflux MFS transporter permease subunit [Bacillus clarus]